MKAKIFTPPHEIPGDPFAGVSLFLAGSIESNKAERWQDKMIDELSDLEITICNPRRPDYDAAQAPVFSNPYFRGQVDWETKYLRKVSTAVFYFDPKTISAITLHELGWMAERNKPRAGRYTSYPGPLDLQRLLVYCPSGYFRQGNVEHTCHEYNIPFFTEYSPFSTATRKAIEDQWV